MAIPNYSLYATSLEYVPVTVTGPAGVNPTGDTVQMAFLEDPPPNQPGTASWLSAIWQGTAYAASYTALCLIGPGGTGTLTAGQWYTWVKLTASPEVPVRYCGITQVS